MQWLKPIYLISYGTHLTDFKIFLKLLSNFNYVGKKKKGNFTLPLFLMILKKFNLI